MSSSIKENEPLFNRKEEYGGILVKNIDEEDLLVSSSSSTETTIDEHDAEYIVKNRLGEATLTTITCW
jgi:hypothetical protein